jgi:hypothetical protein
MRIVKTGFVKWKNKNLQYERDQNYGNEQRKLIKCGKYQLIFFEY